MMKSLNTVQSSSSPLYIFKDSPHLTKNRKWFVWKTFPTIPNLHQCLQVKTTQGTCDWGIHYHIHLSFTKKISYKVLEVAKVSSNTSSHSTGKHAIPGSHVSTALVEHYLLCWSLCLSLLSLKNKGNAQ